MSDTEQYPIQPPNIGSFNFAPGGGVSDTVAAMRWQGDEIKHSLKVTLSCLQPHVDRDDKIVYIRPEGVQPLVNDIGILRLLSIINGAINPSMVLSNIDETKANILILQICDEIVFEIAFNQTRFEIQDGDKGAIMNAIRPLIYAQVYRCVSGHEAQNFRTQTIEQNLQQTLHHNGNGGGFSLNPFKNNRR